MRTHASLWLLVALGACRGGAASEAPTIVPVETASGTSHGVADAAAQDAVADTVVWGISVAPASIPLARVKEVRITISATNRGTAVQDTDRRDSYTLDGVSSMPLNMAFGNGGRERRWQALPPGETVSEARVGLALVDTAGDHVIAIVRGGHELARTTLHVTP